MRSGGETSPLIFLKIAAVPAPVVIALVSYVNVAAGDSKGGV